jgi:hypothetical protein
MNNDLQMALIVVVVMTGLGIVGSVVGVLWYRMVAPSSLDKDTVVFICKLFFGIAGCGVLAYFLFKYVLA